MYHVVFFFFQYDENAEYELIGKALTLTLFISGEGVGGYIKPCQ